MSRVVRDTGAVFMRFLLKTPYYELLFCYFRMTTASQQAAISLPISACSSKV